MSYPAYAETKPSGVDWLGGVPQSWPSLMLKRVVRFAYGMSLADAIREDGPIPVYGSNGIVGSHVVANTEAPAIIVGRKGSYGKVSYSGSPAFAIDTAFFVDKTQTKQDIRWLFYLLSSLNLDSVSQDTGVPGLSREDAYSQYVLLPPLPEQQQIAAFLDRKTAELDAVLSLKERQLQLLAEKRQALISQAVTRGLDPTALLKPSGIPWLGDVPGHWEVNRLKYVSQIISGQSPHESTYNTNGIGVVLINGPAEYSEADFGLTVEAKWTTDPIRWAPKECLLFCLRGSTTGRLNITHAKVSIGRGVAAIVAHEDQDFINYLMVTLRAAVVGTSNGSTFPSVTSETLGNYYLALPSFPEQKAIVAYLDRETARMDGIAQAIRTQIDRVREYRQALISAAVTGKIDVRGV